MPGPGTHYPIAPPPKQFQYATFKYKNLPRDYDAIRLLKLLPSVSENPLVRCELVIQLDEKEPNAHEPKLEEPKLEEPTLEETKLEETKPEESKPDGPRLYENELPNSEVSDCESSKIERFRPELHKYEALSWCWTGGTEDVAYILIHNKENTYQKWVNPNLYAALRALRDVIEHRYLWVDAICINYENLEEKNNQTRIMQSIYDNASKLCIWLGGASESSRIAFKFIKKEVLQSRNFDKLCESRDASKKLGALFELMQRPWFSDRWAMQETHLTREAIIYCGSDSLPWNDFVIAVELLAEFETTSRLLGGHFAKKERVKSDLPDEKEEKPRLGDSFPQDVAGIRHFLVEKQIFSKFQDQLQQFVPPVGLSVRTNERKSQAQKRKIQQLTVESESEDEDGPLPRFAGNGARLNTPTPRRPGSVNMELNHLEVKSERKGAEEFLAHIDDAVTSSEVAKSESCLASERGATNFSGPTLVDTHESLESRVEQDAFLASTKGSEDYMSLLSDDGDLVSQATRQRSEQEILAVWFFGEYLSKSETLRRLHEKALSNLGPSRFLKNYRKILWLYVLKLQVEARTAIEKDTVKVLKSRGNRRTMAQQIITHMAPEYEESEKRLDELSQQPLLKQKLEDWARGAYGLPDVAPDTIPEQTEYSDEENDEEGGCIYDKEDPDKERLNALTYSNVDQAYDFLRKRRPFQTLVLQLALLGLPASLREILETIPKHSIKISANNETSFVNKAKTTIEVYTGTQWDWWPLSPRVPDVAPDRLRLEWQLCDRPLYREITTDEAESIRTILSVVEDHPSNCHCCKVRSFRLDWSTAFRPLFQALSARPPTKMLEPSSRGDTPPSKAGLRYAPSTTIITTGINSSAIMPQSLPMPLLSSSASENSDAHVQSDRSGNNPHPNSFWVVSGIKDMRGFNAIENIETYMQLRDTSFFQDLKERHNKHRLFFQRWFSPYRFRYCRFVQFERIFVDEVSCCGEALPDDHGYTSDYEYYPRPPTAKKPLIDPQRFSIFLTACSDPCFWSLLPTFLHKCRRLPGDSQEWLRIPRKKSAYTLFSESISGNTHVVEKIAFGIEADHMPSSAFFFCYHAIFILSGFGFWVYWLRQHPGDLQNASVPLFTVFGLIAAFWALLGKGNRAS